MQVKTLMNILSEWDENEEIYIGLIMRFTDLLDNLVDEDEWSEIENLFMRSAEVKEEE